MIIINTKVNGLEVWVLLVNDTEQRCFMSHAGVITAAQNHRI